MEELAVRVDELQSRLGDLKGEIQKVIIGQEEVIDQLLITFIAGGHALLEGVPGLAKTLMIRTLARCVDLPFKRIQFTPDLMPSDIIGTEVLEEDPISGKRIFQFNKGPLFANIVLADEINRTPPKTQSALLEAMQEYEVTSAGNTFSLSRPYFILATQNPIEQAGTFPLPEAQLDRFLLNIQLDYPNEEEEFSILSGTTGTLNAQVNKVMSAQEILELQTLVREVSISEDLLRKINLLVRSTRPKHTSIEVVKKYISWGGGPRAGQALVVSAKARALLKGRYAVVKQDIQELVKPVLRHRVLANFKAKADKKGVDELIMQTFKEIGF
ncbi:MoxR family ATPase [Cytophagales bacterium RKSG123]|nr:MoxR family ATPase [Xanthovirga aplysinae]